MIGAAPQVTVVVAAYNEAQALPLLHPRILASLDALEGVQGRVLYVDDGSRDDTWAVMRALAADDPRVSLLRLSRNFGKEAALTASVSFQLVGDSTQTLSEIANDLIPILAKRKELRDVRVDVGDQNSELTVRVDRERAAAFGFSAQEVARFVSLALRGAPLREFRRGETEVPGVRRRQGHRHAPLRVRRTLAQPGPRAGVLHRRGAGGLGGAHAARAAARRSPAAHVAAARRGQQHRLAQLLRAAVAGIAGRAVRRGLQDRATGLHVRRTRGGDRPGPAGRGEELRLRLPMVHRDETE